MADLSLVKNQVKKGWVLVVWGLNAAIIFSGFPYEANFANVGSARAVREASVEIQPGGIYSYIRIVGCLKLKPINQNIFAFHNMYL